MLDDLSALVVALRGQFGPERPSLGSVAGLCFSTYQGLPRQIQAGQSERREHLCSVLGGHLVAVIRGAIQVLDGVKRQHDLRPDRGGRAVEALARAAGHRTRYAGLGRGSPEHAAPVGSTIELVFGLPSVAGYCLVAPVRPMWQRADARRIENCVFIRRQAICFECAVDDLSARCAPFAQGVSHRRIRQCQPPRHKAHPQRRCQRQTTVQARYRFIGFKHSGQRCSRSTVSILIRRRSR